MPPTENSSTNKTPKKWTQESFCSPFIFWGKREGECGGGSGTVNIEVGGDTKKEENSIIIVYYY